MKKPEEYVVALAAHPEPLLSMLVSVSNISISLHPAGECCNYI